MHTDIDYERLYRETIPSVVSLYPGWRDPEEGPSVGAGSGFVYDDSHVVTNQHVVGAAEDVELRFQDGQWRRGSVAGVDAYTDLAIVRVEDLPADATPLPVAESNPEPGRPVAALGNPLGLDGSITAGIVSGANRSMRTAGGFAIPDVVQTDAPINPGNSGGPLVALARETDAVAAANPVGAIGDRSADHDASAGDPPPINDTRRIDDPRATDAEPSSDDEPTYVVVGVNRAKQGDNIGFAISAAIVARVVPALVAEGRYRHSYLRTRTLDVTPAVAEANDLGASRGVLVVDTGVGTTGGDAFRGCDAVRRIRGREVPVGGDVIVGVDGCELHSHEQLMRYLITETRPDESVDVEVVRGGRLETLTVRLDERPHPTGDGDPGRRPDRGDGHHGDGNRRGGDGGGRPPGDREDGDDGGRRIPIR